MDKLTISGFVRNPDVIKSYFKITKGVTVTNKNIRIIFPERYINRGLAIIGTTIKLVSIYAIVDDEGNYAISRAPIYQEVTPFNISDIMIGDHVYKELYFRAGDIVINNNTLVKMDNFMYDLFDEFYIKGNIPWYLDYNDVSDLLLETKKYADSNIGKNPLTMEILASLVARDKTNKKTYYRMILKSKKDIKNNPPVYIGLNNIYYSFNNTGARIVGGYFGHGVTTAIVDQEQKTSSVSNILRA